jgi:hypothetical protein
VIRVVRSAALGLAFVAANCAAQAVYKCGAKGAILYSHEPCVGAEVVDTTPTQGLDKFSGTSRKAAEVQRIESRKIMDQALRPLTGLSPEEMDKRRRRAPLTAPEQAECGRLDGELVRGRENSAHARSEVETFELRRRIRELRC